MIISNARHVTGNDLGRLATQGMLTGFFRVSDEDYHSGPGISASDVVNFLRSPAHYRAAKKTPKQSAAMTFGTQCHEYLLQPSRFNRRYFVEPEGLITGPRNRNPWKAHWDDLKAQAEKQGKELLNYADFAEIKGLVTAVCEHPAAAAMLDCSEREIAAYVQDPDTLLVRKAKADIVTPTGIIADLKTTEDARADAFVRSVRFWSYHVKAAWYLDVFNAAGSDIPFDAFSWIAAEKAAPYGVACYAASWPMLDLGRRTYQKAVEKMASCMAEDKWPCYPAEVQPIEFDDFVYRSAENGN